MKNRLRARVHAGINSLLSSEGGIIRQLSTELWRSLRHTKIFIVCRTIKRRSWDGTHERSKLHASAKPDRNNFDWCNKTEYWIGWCIKLDYLFGAGGVGIYRGVVRWAVRRGAGRLVTQPAIYVRAPVTR